MIPDIIEKYRNTPFEYGKDCCQFVGECVEVVTGENPATEFRYEGEEGANALIAEYGTLMDLLRARFGEPYQGHKDGDVAVCRNAGRYIAGVIYRDRILVRTEKGVTDWPLSYALAIWEV